MILLKHTKILCIFAMLVNQSYAKQNILINRYSDCMETTSHGLVYEHHSERMPYYNMTTSIVPYSKEIKLTQGKVAKVSYWWYEWLNQWKWCLTYNKYSTTLYACRRVSINKKGRLVKLHRAILLACNPKIKVDHIDHNGLNNTVNNLRLSSQLENTRNTTSRKNSSSKYLGVHIHNKVDRRKYKTYVSVLWVASIRCNGKKNHIGIFPYTPEGEVLAAKSYDKKAKEFFGEFANLNFKE